jgi:hypothetical protein
MHFDETYEMLCMHGQRQVISAMRVPSFRWPLAHRRYDAALDAAVVLPQVSPAVLSGLCYALVSIWQGGHSWHAAAVWPLPHVIVTGRGARSLGHGTKAPGVIICWMRRNTCASHLRALFLHVPTAFSSGGTAMQPRVVVPCWHRVVVLHRTRRIHPACWHEGSD